MADLTKTRRNLVILLRPGFSLVSLAGIIDPLGLANELAERECFSWSLASGDGSPVEAANGLPIAVDSALADSPCPDIILVCAADGDTTPLAGQDSAILRGWARQGAKLGAIGSAVFQLAAAGLLDGYRCTTHWSAAAALSEAHPGLRVSNGLYEIDRDRVTCAGGTAIIDMMLHEIADCWSESLARQVADHLMHERIREGSENGPAPLHHRLGQVPEKLKACVLEMESNVEILRPLDELGDHVGLSRRQMERLFTKHMGHTPAKHYLQIRIRRARQLLRQTCLPVTEIAFACGFNSASHFSRCYRDMLGCPPVSERRPHQQAA